MRSDRQVRRARRLLYDDSEMADEGATPQDSFKRGFYLGKIVALDWVLGGPASMVSMHLDHKDYESLEREAGDELEEFLEKPARPQTDEDKEASRWLLSDLDLDDDDDFGDYSVIRPQNER